MSRLGSTTQRGYGSAHQRERKVYVRLIKRGELVVCHFCGQPITQPDGRQPDGLVLDHTPDRTAYRGPAHRHCNAVDGGLMRQHGKPEARRWVL